MKGGELPSWELHLTVYHRLVSKAYCVSYSLYILVTIGVSVSEVNLTEKHGERASWKREI